MTLNGRMPLSAAEFLFQPCMPFGEDALRLIVEMQEWHRLEAISFSADPVGVQLRKVFKGCPCLLSGCRIREPINLSPASVLIRPCKQTKPLDETVVGSPACNGAAYVFARTPRLSCTEQGNANPINMGIAPRNPVERVAARSVPCGQIEPASRRVFLPVQIPEQRDKFVAIDKYAIRIVRQNDAQAFIAKLFVR